MTPTSATGRRTAGFTLVEVLVVVTIIGLMAGVAVIAAPDPRPSLAREAEGFAALLARARQEAVLTGRTVEVAADGDGYRFAVVRAGAREPLAAGPFRDRAWNDAAPAAPARIAFDPTGLASPVRIVLTRKARTIEVAVDSAGNVSLHATGR